MKTYLFLFTSLIVSCGGSQNTATPNGENIDAGQITVPVDAIESDITTGSEVEQGSDNGELSQSDDTQIERYPSLVSPSLTPNLLVNYDPLGEHNLPSGQQYLDDINGDGIREINVHVSGDNDTTYSAVIFGTATGELPAIDDLNGSNGFVLDNLREPPVTVGDLNGDGLAELSFFNSGWFETAQWRVLSGASSYPARRSSLDVLEDELLIHLELLPDTFSAGDVNGDGLDDLLIGATPGTAPRLVYGAADLKLTDPDTMPPGGILDYCNSGFCNAAPVGDFDGDGYSDILVSRFSCRYSDYSAILYGASEGIVPRDTLDEYPVTDLTRIVSETGAECIEGDFTGLFGDIDGDGNSDIVFTNGRESKPNSGGRIIFGQSNPRPQAISIDELDGTKGFSLQLEDDLRITDLNSDGYDDVVYASGKMFPGRLRNTNSLSKPVVRRGVGVLEIHWPESANADVAQYRISVNLESIDIDKMETSVTIEGSWNNDDILLVTLESLNSNGVVMETSERKVPAYPDVENIVVNVLAPRQIEITFNSTASIIRYSQYLVWRNGTPIGRSISGADNYVDSTVKLGSTYEYFITPDYLRNDTLDANLLTTRPLLQRQSNVVEVSTPES